jgi:WD40 repeat protein
MNTSPPAPPLVPDHELLRHIGRGAYGEVWLARSVTGAYRAVKIVHRASFDHDRPFEREFEGILQFEPISRRHDSQVDILHVGRSGDSFYCVMELADDQVTGGQIPDPSLYQPRTLKSDLLFRGRLPFEECVRFGLALATALENLHSHGLVHRDVKPSNIIFVNGVAKLADIGLVTGVDTTRSYVGTEGFAAPEGPGTAQGDLYSLGKVLYEAVTGKDRQEFPELPTQLRELPDRDGLMELNAVIARACRHDPKDRYVSAAAMRADLELLQSGKSLARVHRLEKQLRLVRRAGVGVIALAALIAAGWFWQARQTRLVRDLVTEKTRLVTEKDRLAEESRERIVRLDVANGVRLLDQDDFSGALLWFAGALPRVTNNPPEEAIHRIRIQQVLNQSPRLLHVTHNEEGSGIISSAFSPDGRRIALGLWPKQFQIIDSVSGRLLLGPQLLPSAPSAIRFSADGRQLLFAGYSDEDHGFVQWLDSKTGQDLRLPVTNAMGCSVSSDGRWLAVARTNFVTELLDAASGAHLADLLGHTDHLRMHAFSRDGTQVASASNDGTVRRWQVPSGQEIGSPLRHPGAVTRVAFSPDGRRLATASDPAEGKIDGLVHIWATDTGSEVGTPIPVSKGVRSLAFDKAAGRHLLVGDDERCVKVFDAETHLPAYSPLAFESSTLRCSAFSRDGLRLAAGSDDGTTRVWDLETGTPLTPRLRHEGWVESVNFSPDGHRLLTTSDDGTAKVWDLAATPGGMRELRLDQGSPDLPPTQFAKSVSASGNRLLLGVGQSAVELVNLGTLTPDGGPMSVPDGATPGLVTFDDTGHQWAVTWGIYLSNRWTGPQEVGLWREERGQVRRLLLNHPEVVSYLRFSSDGTRLWTWCKDRKLRTWRTLDGELMATRSIASDDATLEMLDLSPYGSRAVMAGAQGAMSLIDLGEPNTDLVPLANPRPVYGWALSPDGTRLATIGLDQSGQVYDANTGRAITSRFKHGGALQWVEWSPDGRLVLTAGLAGNVRVWDATTGESARAPLQLGSYPVSVAHFSPDGRFVVARGDDRTARVWDLTKAEPITPILHHAGKVTAALITAENRLVTVSSPDRLSVWDLKPSALPVEVIGDYARLLAGRRLDAGGVMLPIPAKELTELARSLRRRAPQLFE